MDTKHGEQIKPVIEEWHFSNSLVSLLGILAPAAFLAIIFGHSGTFLEFLFNADYWKTKGSRYTKTRKKSQDIYFSKWLLNFLSLLKFRNNTKTEIGTESPHDIWRDGSILCNLVNKIVPGACKDPRSHRLQTPQHGQKLVYEYLDIKPIFTSLELSQKSLSQTQEKKFSIYLNKIHQIIQKDNDNINNMKFSTDYVARGMGLVVAQQNKKSTFYIYPIPKRYPNTCDLEISIKGPCGNNGKITIPSISQYNQKCQPSTEYRRSLYMSSKLNSISPTLQGSSFLRKLSLTSEDTHTEMDIRVKLSTTRVKVSYVPEKTGIYEISLVTRGCHVVGSPYSVPVELATISNYCPNDTDSESEEETKYIYRKRKVISRIVDFIDEKMLLQDDGTLVKIDDNHKNMEKNDYKKNHFNKTLSTNEDFNTKKNKILDESRVKAATNINLPSPTNKKEINNHLENIDNISKSEMNSSKIDNFNKQIQQNKELELEENNNYMEIKIKTDLLNSPTKNNQYIEEEENNNINGLIFSNNHINYQNNDSDIQEMNTNKIVSDSFTSVNDLQILNSNDPTLKSKVQDPQFDLKKPIRKDLKKENHVAEDSFKFSSLNNEENPSFYNISEDPVLFTSNQSLKKRLKKMGAILENYDDHQCSLKNHVNYNIQQCIDKTVKNNTSNGELSLVEKQKQFWIKKMTQTTNNSNTLKYQKPPKILKSSFVNTSLKRKEENHLNTAVLSFDGIVENNIKFFEVQLSPESSTQKKTTFKIDIPKFNLNETIIVKNIEIVTKTEENITPIKLPSLEERKSKFLQACNKPLKPRRLRNKVIITCDKQDDDNLEDNKHIDDLQLNSLNIEKNMPEVNVSVRRKYRFKRAKLFFQSLEKTLNNSENDKISEKHLGIISIKAESDSNNIKEENENSYLQCLRKSNSDSENLLRNANKTNSKISRSESDPCVNTQLNRKTPIKLFERFHVTGLFKDVLEDSRFIGLPNKKAVVASLASLDTNSETFINNLNEDINEVDYFEKQTIKHDENENNIPGYHKDFPHTPNKNYWKHRSKDNSEITGLIPGRTLLGGNVENFI